LALIIFVVSEKKAFEHFPIYEIQNGSYGRTLFNIGPYGKNVSKHFFSETTWSIETNLPKNDHWKVLCHFEFDIGAKSVKFVEDHPMNIHVQFGFNNICSF
jgi:hypothetical protein